MSNKQHILRLGAILAAGTLLGCQAIAPTVRPPQVTQPTSVATAIQPAAAEGLPQVVATTTSKADEAMGSIRLSIKWPVQERSTQAIPASANTVRVRIYTVDASSSAQTDAFNELIARPTGTQWDSATQQNVPVAFSSASYMLKKNTPYYVEVKVYAELKASVVGGSTAIAFTSTPSLVNLTANQTQDLALTLTALYQPTLATATYAAGGGANFEIAGTGFGTDAAKIKVYYKLAENNLQAMTVVSVSDTKIVATMLDQSQLGDLVVTRDGVTATIASGPVKVQGVYNLDLPYGSMWKQGNYDNSVNTYNYFVEAGRQLSLNPTGSWGGTWYDLATYSVSVTNITGGGNTNVSASTFAGGKLTLPDGKFKVVVNSGSRSSSNFYVTSGVMGWPSLAAIQVSPYYLPGINDTSGLTSVSLADANLTSANDGGTTNFAYNDFNWTYAPTGVTSLDTNASNASNAKFKAFNNSVLGTATTSIIGTLKYDSSRTVTIPVKVARITGMNMAYSTNYGGTWTAGSTLSVNVGQDVDYRVNSFVLSDGTTLALDNNARNNLGSYWDPITQTTVTGLQYSSVDESVASIQSGGSTGRFRAAAAGSTTVRLNHWKQNTVFGTLGVTVQNP